MPPHRCMFSPPSPPPAGYHYIMFFALLGGGLLFLALLLYTTGDIEFQRAVRGARLVLLFSIIVPAAAPAAGSRPRLLALRYVLLLALALACCCCCSLSLHRLVALAAACCQAPHAAALLQQRTPHPHGRLRALSRASPCLHLYA